MKNKWILLITIITMTFLLTVGCSEKPKTAEDIIKNAIHEVVGKVTEGENSISKFSFINGETRVTIKKQSVSKDELFIDSREIFEKLFENEELEGKIKNIYVEWEGKFKSGSYFPVMQIGISKKTFDEVHWETIGIRELDTVVDEYRIHDELK